MLAAIVGDEVDVTDLLAHLVDDCARATGAVAVAILARVELDGARDELALLTATSHRAVEIEMLQAQRRSGPCVEAIGTGAVVVATGDDLVARWGDVGRAIRDAGFEEVEAYPMRWRGESLGGLNVFRAEARQPGAALTGQAYADVASLVVAQSAVVSPDLVRAGLATALESRALVEQAKGVLAYVGSVDMEQAYRELLRRADEADVSLTTAADSVVRRRGAR